MINIVGEVHPNTIGYVIFKDSVTNNVCAISHSQYEIEREKHINCIMHHKANETMASILLFQDEQKLWKLGYKKIDVFYSNAQWIPIKV